MAVRINGWYCWLSCFEDDVGVELGCNGRSWKGGVHANRHAISTGLAKAKVDSGPGECSSFFCGYPRSFNEEQFHRSLGYLQSVGEFICDP